jgi:hypothetical protein
LAGAVLASHSAVSRSSLRVVAVSGDSQRPALLEALTMDANDCDVVFVEAIAGGYPRIKECVPHLIIMMLEIDDPEACQLLSMLMADRSLSGIPVVTWTTGPKH